MTDGVMLQPQDDADALNDVELRPCKRMRLAIDDGDSAYVSLSSSIVDHDMHSHDSATSDAFKLNLDAMSTTSIASKRPKTFHCTYEGCDKAFDRPARLEIHIRSHTQDRPFVCEQEDCDKSFLRSEHLKAHIKSKHSDIRNYTCTYEVGRSEEGEVIECGKSFHTGTRLRRHIAAHEDKEQTKCQECGQIFRKQETLQRHIRSEHLGENAFRCRHVQEGEEECGQTFPTVGQLKAHESREHAGLRYYCNVCHDANGSIAVGFSTYSDLQAHLKLAHPPACNLCGESCPSSRALRAHMDIVHSAITDRQRFECEHAGCGRKFTKKGNLQVHVRTVHGKQKDYTCGQYDLRDSVNVPGWSGMGCGSSFGTKASLEGHIRTQHLGLPASCKASKASTKTLSNQMTEPANTIFSSLTGHAYEEARPHQCLEQTCGSRFRREHELVVHLELHHGWNIDDINDCLAEAVALQGDKFWLGGDNADQDSLLDQFIVNNLSISTNSRHEGSPITTPTTQTQVQTLDPTLR